MATRVIQALNSRQGIVGFTAIVFSVDGVGESNTDPVASSALDTLSDQTWHIGLSDVLALEADKYTLFRFEHSGGSDCHAISVEIEALSCKRWQQPAL